MLKQCPTSVARTPPFLEEAKAYIHGVEDQRKRVRMAVEWMGRDPPSLTLEGPIYSYTIGNYSISLDRLHQSGQGAF
jgi:hypothetical protein